MHGRTESMRALDILKKQKKLDDDLDEFWRKIKGFFWSDPIILDLNHNKTIDTISVNDSNVYFDMFDNGILHHTGWVGHGDGLLVYDKDNNGQIEGINELFGNENIDGFTELQNNFNSNHDFKITIDDERYDKLKVWIDNGDGKVQDGEIKTLAELNITSINLNNVNTNTNYERQIQ